MPRNRQRIEDTPEYTEAVRMWANGANSAAIAAHLQMPYGSFSAFVSVRRDDFPLRGDRHLWSEEMKRALADMVTGPNPVALKDRPEAMRKMFPDFKGSFSKGALGGQLSSLRKDNRVPQAESRGRRRQPSSLTSILMPMSESLSRDD